MKKLILGLFILVHIFSCTKEELPTPIPKEVTAKTDTLPLVSKLNKTNQLFGESYPNQKSGNYFVWHHIRHLWPYMPQLDSDVKSWYGNGQAYGDVNKDGFQDILVSNVHDGGEGEMTWFVNSGDNYNYKKQNYFNQSTKGYKAHKILKTDVNSDGLADYIALGVDERIQGNYTGNFTVLIQKPNGFFDVNDIPNPQRYWFHNGAAGDLNGDGNVDVVTATFIWWGDGKGNFTNSFINVEQYSKALVYEVLDINGDKYNDLILRGPFQNTTIVFSNKGVWDSQNNKIILPSVEYKAVMDLEFMDFDGDGDIDILEMAQLGGNPPESNEPKYFVSKITVFYNNNLQFIPDENVLNESVDGNYINGKDDVYGWSNFKIDDIDGDGIEDIVAENFQDGTYNGLKKINGIWKKYIFKLGK
jgi:hypothetical protein